MSQETKEKSEMVGTLHHKDIFRTLLMIYRTNNYVPIDACAKFVVELMSRPCLGKEADERLYQRIIKALSEFSRDGVNLKEREFCEMMQWVEDADAQQDPEEEYDRFLTKLFNAQKNRKTDCIGIQSLKGMIEKGGFQFEEAEYKELVQAYFRNKSEISLEEFKLFAKGQCVKLTKPTLKSLNL